MSIYSLRKKPKNHYVYAYLNDNNLPYYIGKGVDYRAWSKQHTVPIPNNDKIIIMESNLTEIGAFSLERFYIRWYGRKDLETGILLNKTDGGESFSGKKSQEWKNNNSLKFMGDNNPMKRPEVREKISGKNHGMYGKTHSEEYKKRLKENRLAEGNPMYGKKRKDLSEYNKRINILKVECPHCKKTGSFPIMQRWHFKNCKSVVTKQQY